MAIKRYFALNDNTITNAYMSDLSTLATGSNMGAADILEVFSIYGQTISASATSSAELSRVLIKFDVTGSGFDSIKSERTSGRLPSSGSVNFYLKLFNAQHARTVPIDYTLDIAPVQHHWQEGSGLDMDTYKDLTKNRNGSNWMSASNSPDRAWTTPGGDYLATYNYSQDLSTGLEDLEVDITPLVEGWIAGTLANYGVGVKLSASQEAYYSSSVWGFSGVKYVDGILLNTTGAQKSYYTKRFFGRNSQYFFKRPTIEARWDSSRKDNRGSFYYSSSLAPSELNLNTLFLYNRIRGRLTNIPEIGTGNIYVSIYSGSALNTEPSGSRIKLAADGTHVGSSYPYVVTGSHVSTGIYSCKFAITGHSGPRSTVGAPYDPGTGSLTKLFDVWHNNAGTQFFTGTVKPKKLDAQDYNNSERYATKVVNLKPEYRSNENARLRVFARQKGWSPTIYTVASRAIEASPIDSGSFRVVRLIDNYEVFPHATGANVVSHSMMSCDISGNYFDLDMSLLEPGYAYGLKFAYYNELLQDWVEQPEIFKFMVDEYER
jgi:hypothetical protein